MNKLFLLHLVFFSFTYTTIAEAKHSHTEDNQTTIQIQSIRDILGNNDPINHLYGQVRAGYIALKQDNSKNISAYGFAGHVHYNSIQWYGLTTGVSAYTIFNPNQKKRAQNEDFFNQDSERFLLISEAYIKGKWYNTELKLGRQILDTPHVDSDDIRLIPNYFEAYTLTNTDYKNLTLTTGLIRKMAGWENGVDSSKFVHISQTLATESTNGILYAAGMYDGITDVLLLCGITIMQTSQTYFILK